MLARKKAEAWSSPETNEQRIIYEDICDSKQESLRGQGKACKKDLHIPCLCTTEKRPVRVVVVMRILLQLFTSFGCHGYTARGPSSWTARREHGEGGMLGSMALSVAASPLFPCMHQLTGPGI